MIIDLPKLMNATVGATGILADTNDDRDFSGHEQRQIDYVRRKARAQL
jgi:hypothetical protein